MNLWRSFIEAGTMTLDLASMNWENFKLRLHYNELLRTAPDGDGRPVLVLPGFAMGDMSTQGLRDFLSAKGYSVYGWGGGVNRGPDPETLRHLKGRVDDIFARHDGQKVHLIGHSLGGFYARELNREFPDRTAAPITLGTPFLQVPEDDRQVLRKVFEMVSGPGARLLHDQALLCRASAPPPGPTTSIYTRKDGIIDWVACLNPDGPYTENIEIDTSHCGLILHPSALLAVADRLAQDPESWAPFDPARYARFSLPFHRDQAHHSVTIPQPCARHAYATGPSLFPA